MITTPIHTILYDGDRIAPDADLYQILNVLQRQHGIFIWCRQGEYRAIGGPQINTWCQAIDQHDSLRDNYTVADSQLRQFFCLDWETLHPIDPMIVHWLRDEAEQLGETDPTADTTAE